METKQPTAEIIAAAERIKSALEATGDVIETGAAGSGRVVLIDGWISLDVLAEAALAGKPATVRADEMATALRSIADGLADTCSDRTQRMTKITKADAYAIAVNALAKSAESERDDASIVNAANAHSDLVAALEDCAELIELERGAKGCSGHGDHKDRHADAEWPGSSEALSKAYAALAKAES
jgi:hypothetical protein